MFCYLKVAKNLTLLSAWLIIWIFYAKIIVGNAACGYSCVPVVFPIVCRRAKDGAEIRRRSEPIAVTAWPLAARPSS